MRSAQVMVFGQTKLELRAGDVANGVFGSCGVGFQSGGALGRGGLAGQKISFESRSHVRSVPEAHFIGQRER